MKELTKKQNELTKTTRALILSRIKEIREKLSQNKRLIETEDKLFNQMRELESDILRVEEERLNQCLINNFFTFEQ